MEKLRVLLADDDQSFGQKLKAYPLPQEIDLKISSSVADAKKQLKLWSPQFIVADLILPGGGAYHLLDYLKTENSIRHQITNLIVLSEHNSVANVKEAIRRGALDYVVKPCLPADLLKRIILHIQPRRVPQAEGRTEMDATNLMLHLVELVMRQSQSHQPVLKKLFQITRMLSLKMEGVRCSIVHCISLVDGLVIASHDRSEAFGIKLDLQKYPEILQVINSGRLFAIENIAQLPGMAHLGKLEKEIEFNSMILCPLFKKREFFGVLSLRLPAKRGLIQDFEVRFVEIVSHILSHCLTEAGQALDQLITNVLSNPQHHSPRAQLSTFDNKQVTGSDEQAKILSFKATKK